MKLSPILRMKPSPKIKTTISLKVLKHPQQVEANLGMYRSVILIEHFAFDWNYICIQQQKN